ncbi:hypothetical protein DYB25_011906 [Aphanomyces astaci]|uniref:Fe2OG dioxygenase domain-containing protein n=1 Tax=Aphanomyces astaci TaxID=112090 RepID=A0A397B9Y1_APHAT|nr:hypothetical protein DYB25_011906 [Aphanomyces astaci]
MYLEWKSNAAVQTIVFQHVLPRVEHFFPNNTIQIESTALTRYAKGQSYSWHVDAYDEHTLHSRAITFLLYLNDVDVGGETHFTMDNDAIKFIDVPKAVTRTPVRKKGAPKILQRKSIHLGWEDDDVGQDGPRGDSTVNKEMFVLEFYNPQLQSPHGRRPTTTVPVAHLIDSVLFIDSMRQSRSVLTFVDPLEDATRRDLKRSNLLHPVAVPLVMSDAATPLHVGAAAKHQQQPQRCPQCNSNHVIMVPVCKYCKTLDVLTQDHTALKRHAYALVEKHPSIAPTQVPRLQLSKLFTVACVSG